MCPARIACQCHPTSRRPARQLRKTETAQFRLSPSCRVVSVPADAGPAADGERRVSQTARWPAPTRRRPRKGSVNGRRENNTLCCLRGWAKSKHRSGPSQVDKASNNYASHLVSSGLSLPIVGRLMGHTQAQTTPRYARLAGDPLRQAAERFAATYRAAGKRKGRPHTKRTTVDGR